MAMAHELGWPDGGGCSDLRLRRLAQRKLRQVIELLDPEEPAELGHAFVLVEDAGLAIDQLLQQRERDDG